MPEVNTERHLKAQIAALKSWQNTDDRTGRTANARAAADARFEKQVDPDGVLPPEERAKRAAAARRLFYKQLTLKRIEKKNAARQRQLDQLNAEMAQERAILAGENLSVADQPE